MDPDGRGGKEEIEGVVGGKTTTRMYCMRKCSIFNKREIIQEKINEITAILITDNITIYI